VQRRTTGPVGAIRLDRDQVPPPVASLALGVLLGKPALRSTPIVELKPVRPTARWRVRMMRSVSSWGPEM